jgi:hypothetical protein
LAFVESAFLLYPWMYFVGHLTDIMHIEHPSLQWIFPSVTLGVPALPIAAALLAWGLISFRRSSGWYLAAATDVCLTLMLAALVWALYESPPSSGRPPWVMLFVMIALPLTHLAVIAVPLVRRNLLPQMPSTDAQLPQTS